MYERRGSLRDAVFDLVGDLAEQAIVQAGEVLAGPVASCVYTSARKSSMSKLGSTLPGWTSSCPATDFSDQPCARQIAAAHSTAWSYCASG